MISTNNILLRDISQEERARLEHKKKLLQLAKEHQKLETKTKVDGYVIPDLYMDEHEEKRNKEAQQVCACVCVRACVCVCVSLSLSLSVCVCAWDEIIIVCTYMEYTHISPIPSRY